MMMILSILSIGVLIGMLIGFISFALIYAFLG